ncbi:MAG: hypothetical protein FJ405_04645 [Verrucomicrobia bacterium]|nr:hypothetical protein [Verrucomicrobiota bacterium]
MARLASRNFRSHLAQRCWNGCCTLWVLLFLGTVDVPAQLNGVHRELYLRLSRDSFSLARLTNHPGFLAGKPDQTNIISAGFQTEQDRGEDYGQRLRAWLVPSTTGNHTFSIAADETAQLFLSSDDNPGNKRLIAWVDPRSQPGVFNVHTGQQSAPIALEAGRRYYIEALHHEANLIDHLSVQWRLPNGTIQTPIPNLRLLREIPPSLVTDLVDMTVEEGRPVRFAPSVANFLPQRHRWQREGSDIPGATQATFDIPAASLADNAASFQCIITNVLGASTTRVARLTVLTDVTAPRLLRVQIPGLNSLIAYFSEALHPAKASLPSNYRVDAQEPLSARWIPEWNAVQLEVPDLAPGTSHTLTVSGLSDLAQTPNVIEAVSRDFIVQMFHLDAMGAGSDEARLTEIAGPGWQLRDTGRGTGLLGRVDGFSFAWRMVAGDFDIHVRVEMAEDGRTSLATAGLMVREDLDPQARSMAVLAGSGLRGAMFLSRSNRGVFPLRSGNLPGSSVGQWVRLQRVGHVFRGFASYDAGNWTLLGVSSAELPPTLLIGLALAGDEATRGSTASFSGYSEIAPAGPLHSAPLVENVGPSSRKTGLIISELMYHPGGAPVGGNASQLEFVEIRNTSPFPEDISGFRLSGDVEFTFPPDTQLAPGEFGVVAKSPSALQSRHPLVRRVFGPYSGTLPNTEGRIRLRNANGFVLLDVSYSSLHPWPASADGAGHSLVLARPSFGEGDSRSWYASRRMGGSPGLPEPIDPDLLDPLVLNEFLAGSTSPAVDYVEIFNRSFSPVDAGGCWVTDAPGNPRFRIPSPALIPGRGHLRLDQAALGFGLSGAGERLFLVHSNNQRVLDAVRFGGQGPEVSFGRSPDGAEVWMQLKQQTPGELNSPPVASRIIINEINYHPIHADELDEFVELHNAGDQQVDVSLWRLTDAIRFEFPTNTVIGPGAFVVVARNKARLLSSHPGLAPESVVGEFEGSLGNSTERIALERWIAVEVEGPLGTRQAQVRHVLEDEVTYRDGGRWSKWADGGGSSLELVDPRSDNSLPANWAASDESGKAPWTLVEATGPLDNGLGSIDALRVGLLEEGECMLDDVQVISGSGPNRISNSNFETSATGWLLRGSHERSSVEAGGYNSVRALKVRASSRTDAGANRIETALTWGLSEGQTVTLRARARWVRGWPELLLRLRGGWMEAVGRLDLPRNLGTPGKVNSRFLPNAAPAIVHVQHSPALPQDNAPVVVSARIQDPDGVTSVKLRYRLDPSAQVLELQMADDGLAPDLVANDGLYTVSLPPHPAGTLIAFRIEAMDAGAAPMSAVYPAPRDDNGPAHEGLIRYGEPVAAGEFGAYRFWATGRSVTNWMRREVLSNEPIPGTFVYGDQRVIHEAGAHYAGSPAHQDQAAPDFSPIGTPNNYVFEVPKDEPVLGTERLNKVHGAGNNHHDDNTLLRETAAYWIASQVGLPANHKRFVSVFINGARRGTLMEDTQVPNNDVLESVFPEDADGDLHKISVWYELTGTSQVMSSVGSSEAYLSRYSTAGGVRKTARYRYNWQPRALTTSANSFSNLFQLVDTANLASAAFEPAFTALADSENWMRTFAVQHAVGNWDSFGYRNQQNMYAYKPGSGPWSLLIWDINIVFGGGTRGVPIAVDGDLVEYDTSDPAMNKLYTMPVFRRAYWRGLQAIAQDALASSKFAAMLDSRSQAFQHDGIWVTEPSAIKTFAELRKAYILRELAKVDAKSFQVLTPLESTVTTNTAQITGWAPVAVRWIQVNGASVAPVWTSLTNWSVRLPVEPGTNRLRVVALDSRSQATTNGSVDLVVISSGNGGSPVARVRVNEWMASNTSKWKDPADDQYEDWFELYNAGNAPLDLGGSYLSDDPLNPRKFRIPAGYWIAPGAWLLVWADEEPEQNTPALADLHAGFKLSAAGESILVAAPDGRILDSVSFAAQVDNVSQGRFPDGADSVSQMGLSTPRGANRIDAPAVPPRFVSVRPRAQGGWNLSWTVEPGRNYRVEWKERLLDTTWNQLGTLVATEPGDATMADPEQNASARFYRVLVMEE